MNPVNALALFGSFLEVTLTHAGCGSPSGRFPRARKSNGERLRIDSDSAEVILLAAGQAHWFDVETGFYPNEQ